MPGAHIFVDGRANRTARLSADFTRHVEFFPDSCPPCVAVATTVSHNRWREGRRISFHGDSRWKGEESLRLVPL